MSSQAAQKLCRLCFLQTVSDDSVNIWDKFQNSTIASIVTKHFWFEIHEDDDLTEWLCTVCWNQTKSFHTFYQKIETQQQNYYKSIELIGASAIKRERSGSPLQEREPIDPDLYVVKYEQVESPSESNSKDDSSGCHKDDDDDDTSCENSENSDDDEDDQPLSKRFKTATNNAAKSKRQTSSKKEQTAKEEENEQIRKSFALKCDICNGDEFESWLKVRQHYRKAHATDGYLTCCGRKFQKRSDIMNHIRHHSSTQNEDADASSQVGKDDQDKQIREFFSMKCELCVDVELENLLRVRQHYRKVHQIPGYLTCCGRKFTKRCKILDHIRYHTNPKALRCDECGKVCKDKNSLKLHISNHVPMESREYKCNLCTSSFTKPWLLKIHMRSKHTSKTGEDFPCDKCDKIFRSKILRTCHIRNVHEFSLEQVCEICARRFKTIHSLRNHIQNEHSDTPKPPQPKVQCNICGAWLKHKHVLRMHIKVMHVDPNSSEILTCHLCNKEVHSKNALNRHLRSSHGERRFPCVLCNKAFKCAKNLREHMACHTGEDLYSCAYCEKTFKSNANMYTHRKKAHPVEWSRDSLQRISLRKASSNEDIEVDLSAFSSKAD